VFFAIRVLVHLIRFPVDKALMVSQIKTAIWNAAGGVSVFLDGRLGLRSALDLFYHKCKRLHRPDWSRLDGCGIGRSDPSDLSGGI